MVSSKDLIRDFGKEGLNFRLLKDLEAQGILHREKGGQGRGKVFEYRPIAPKPFRYLLRRLNEGVALDVAYREWLIEAAPAVLLVTHDAFLFAGLKQRLSTTNRTYWATDEAAAKRYLSSADDQRICALVCEAQVSAWSDSPTAVEPAARLMQAGLQRKWNVQSFGTKCKRPELPAEVMYHQLPVRVETLTVGLRAHFVAIETQESAA
jgi:hypothetical protein